MGRQDVAFCGRFRAASDALIDEIATGCRPEAEADPAPRVRRALRVTSAVPSEHEPVKVALGAAQAVADALRPALAVREDAVDPRQEIVRLPARDDTDLVGVGGRGLLTQPAVADDMRTGRDGPTDETVQRSGISVGDVRHPDSAGNRAAKAWRDIGRSDFQRASITEHLQNIARAASPHHHIVWRRSQGDKPSPSV